MKITSDARRYAHLALLSLAQRSRVSMRLGRRKASAKVIYENIIRQFPAHALTRSQEIAIRRYCKSAFGDVRHVPELQVYTAWRGEFIEGWMPQEFFFHDVLPRIQGELSILGQIRTLQSRIFGRGHFPDLLCCINGQWLSPYENKRFEIHQVASELFGSHAAIYLKSDQTNRSQGVLKLASNSFDPVLIAKSGNWVAQAPIVQERTLADFMPDNVASIRINTLILPDGAIGHRANFIRFGRSGQDSFAGKSPIFIPIVDNAGRLAETGMDRDWNAMSKHPDSLCSFGGYQIPGFVEACSLCEALHSTLPMIGIIGWDVAIDSNGTPVIMELNTNKPTILYTEPSTGPHFADTAWQQFARK